MKKYAFFDLDKTLYDGYSNNKFYYFMAQRGYGSDWVYKRDREIGVAYGDGTMSYAQATVATAEICAFCIKGVSVAEVEGLMVQFMAENNCLFPWVQPLFERLLEKRYEIYLISGSTNPNVEAIADFLKVKNVFSTRLEIKKNRYTGKILNVLNYEEKMHTVHRILGHLVKHSKKMGFGDSTGDVPMLELMDHTLVHEPHEKEMITIAQEHGWPVVSRDTMLATACKFI